MAADVASPETGRKQQWVGFLSVFFTDKEVGRERAYRKRKKTAGRLEDLVVPGGVLSAATIREEERVAGARSSSGCGLVRRRSARRKVMAAIRVFLAVRDRRKHSGGRWDL